MPSIKLCPGAKVGPEFNKRDHSSRPTGDNEVSWDASNRCAEKLVRKRNKENIHATHKAVTWRDKVEALISALEDDSLEPTADPAIEDPRTIFDSSAHARPLEGAILAIIWEIHYTGMFEAIVGPWNDIHCGKLQDFVTLLSFAATYEVNSTKFSLDHILICLGVSATGGLC